ncbi:MAG TPA: glycosyltransferase family 2 protein [Cyclobacteriaceae bacterium]|jgi:glycosyltransferase involved in cell wall biosynthesis|nr:MAG: hypothetical protein DIU61_20030 [Bacteroidota bacterium]
MQSGGNSISILISAFNCEKYIGDTLKSLIQQTYGNFEILVADDGSDDRTKVLIDSFSDPRIKTFHNHKNLGKTRTINKLLTFASGTWITIHDADDISVRTRLEKQINYLQANPSVMMCGTNYDWVTERGDLVGTMAMPETWDDIKKRLPTGNAFHLCSALIRRDAIDELGEFLRPFFRDHNEDIDLAYRIAERFESYNIQEALYVYRANPSSLTNRLNIHRSAVAFNIVRALAEQRRKSGKDDLQLGHVERVKELEAQLMHGVDRFEVLEKQIARLNYLRLYSNAIKTSLFLIRSFPSRIRSYRVFFYTLRKFSLSFFES